MRIQRHYDATGTYITTPEFDFIHLFKEKINQRDISHQQKKE